MLNTTSIDAGKGIKTYRGVPQGSVLSPALFSVYIASLLTNLASSTLARLAYADDICIACQSKADLERSLSTIDKWCKTHAMQLNKAKSGIIAVRLDGRTRAGTETLINQIRLVKRYKYLGVEVDEFLRLKAVKKDDKYSHRTMMKKFIKTF